MKPIHHRAIAIIVACLMLQAQVFPRQISTVVTLEDAGIITDFDDSEIYAAFEAIQDFTEELTTVSENTEMSHSAVLSLGIDSRAALPLSADDVNGGEDPLGIPSFIWGFVLGLWGIVIVYLMTENNKVETKKALNGCLVANGVTAVIGICYVVIVLLFASSASTSPGYNTY